jgi:flavin-dependent dehydrogenase
LRVLLAERSRFDRRRFGETAPPEIKALLAQLDLAHVLEGKGHLEASATVSVWGSFEPSERNHITSPYGSALHLDRRAFDTALSGAAQDAGADLRLATSIRFEHRPRSGYDIITSAGERTTAGIAVLANGRSTGGSGLPYVRSHLDDHAAVVGWFESPPSRQEHCTLIEAVPGGWFYLVQLCASCIVVVLVTRALSVPAGKADRRRWWLAMLARTTIVRSALIGCAIPRELSVCDARASFAAVPAGEDWLAIGDARLAPDPLAGCGIAWAIDDAVFAAQIVVETGTRDLASVMMERTRRDVADYLAVSDRVYADERRFPTDAYWRSRASATMRD